MFVDQLVVAITVATIIMNNNFKFQKFFNINKMKENKFLHFILLIIFFLNFNSYGKIFNEKYDIIINKNNGFKSYIAEVLKKENRNLFSNIIDEKTYLETINNKNINKNLFILNSSKTNNLLINKGIDFLKIYNRKISFCNANIELTNYYFLILNFNDSKIIITNPNITVKAVNALFNENLIKINDNENYLITFDVFGVENVYSLDLTDKKIILKQKREENYFERLGFNVYKNKKINFFYYKKDKLFFTRKYFNDLTKYLSDEIYRIKNEYFNDLELKYPINIFFTYKTGNEFIREKMKETYGSLENDYFFLCIQGCNTLIGFSNAQNDNVKTINELGDEKLLFLHELSHLIFNYVVKGDETDRYLLREGIAVFLTGKFVFGPDLISEYKTIKYKEKFHVRDFLSKTNMNSEKEYIISGLFVKYLIENYGVEKFIYLYKNINHDNIHIIFEKVYNINDKNLDQDFNIYLNKIKNQGKK